MKSFNVFWLVRDYRTKEALHVFEDEDIITGVIQAENGLHVIRVDHSNNGTYVVSRRRKSEDVGPGEILWECRMMIEPITEAEYQTYKEFGLFPETS